MKKLTPQQTDHLIKAVKVLMIAQPEFLHDESLQLALYKLQHNLPLMNERREARRKKRADGHTTEVTKSI